MKSLISEVVSDVFCKTCATCPYDGRQNPRCLEFIDVEKAAAKAVVRVINLALDKQPAQAGVFMREVVRELREPSPFPASTKNEATEHAYNAMQDRPKTGEILGPDGPREEVNG